MTLEGEREGSCAVNSQELLKERGLALLSRVQDRIFESIVLGLNRKRPTFCHIY
jgi:hypothetical protein